MSFRAHSMVAGLEIIPGFESTAYRYAHGRVVWAGDFTLTATTPATSATRHPRDFLAPWQPVERRFEAERLRRGARACRHLFDTFNVSNVSNACNAQRLQAKGLMLWLTGQPMAFPLNHAVARFDAIGSALLLRDARQFEAAAIRVLGLGHGLTPSGDDFVGGVFFALRHLPENALGAAWRRDLPKVAARIRIAADTQTNAISAALLGDLMQGVSYSPLHDFLAALESESAIKIEAAYAHILRLGATSGSDILAGMLLALTLPPLEIETADLQESP